jgi:hypothetical protein
VAGDDEAEMTKERETTEESHVSETTEESHVSETTEESSGSDASESQISETIEELLGSDDSESQSSQGEVSSLTGEQEDLDSAADSFLEVEQEFDGMVEGMQLRGQAIDVSQIPATEVPDDFPYDIQSEDALALTLELTQMESQTVTTYFEWPTDGADKRLGKLLSLRDVPLDRFADLHGEKILLTVENGHVVPVLPEEERRGSDKGILGILGGMAPSALIFVAGLLGLGGLVGNLPFLLLWLIGTFFVLPISTYYDAWDLRTTTNWEGGPLFWATLMMIPGLNILGVAAYLIVRQNAEPII